MVLWLVEKLDGEDEYDWVQPLEPEEDAALRTIKGGEEAGEDMRALYLRTVGHARDNGYWFMCDCRFEDGRGPVIVPRQDTPERMFLVNRPGASLPHARDCVFALTGDEEDSPSPRRWAPQPAHDDTFDPFAPARKKSRADGPMETVTPRAFTGLPAGSRHRTAANMLRTLMQTARLNTLDGAGRFSSPPEWLPEIARAAEQFFIADDVPASEFLFTDPANWADGEVARRLEEAEPGWRKGRKPYAMLCWLARDLSDGEINPATPQEGRVKVREGVKSPKVFLNRVPGPWLFLGIVARPEDGEPWECLAAWAQPIVAPEWPVPVDSGQERRAFHTLCRLAAFLEDDMALRRALGGGIRIQLEKPLTNYETALGPCLPDFVLTVTMPAPTADGESGHPDDGTMVRYVVEVMGLDDPGYERKKARTRARMHRIGRPFRMEATEFDSRFNDIERQGERIAQDIANDLVWRWGPATGE